MMTNEENHNELLKKLMSIENLLQKNQINQKTVLTLEEFCTYTDYSSSTVYKLTSGREVPHYTVGRRVFFNREQIEQWLMQNPIKTNDQIRDNLLI